MAEEVRLWGVDPASDELTEVCAAALDREDRLQEWLARDIRILDPGLMVTGREVETDYGGYIDLLCIDQTGDLAIVELK